MRCPCGSDKDYDQCCGAFLSGRARPPTAEALMRSRYSAYALGNIGYIERTTAPESRAAFDSGSARAWSTEATWLGLRIVATEGGGVDSDAGIVEFVATYRRDGATLAHRERSRFRRTDGGEWRYVDGESGSTQADARRPAALGGSALAFPGATPKVGRNDLCPCGSGKKFKKCCGTGAA